MTPETLDHDINAGATLADIALLLDGLDDAARQSAMLGLGRTAQKRLYNLAAEAEPLALSDFVPDDAAPLQPVAHCGLNTLPLPTVGKRFTKWMTRSDDGSIVGYNASPFRRLIGPGYFVLRESDSEAADRGAVVVDYYQTPQSSVPSEWPWVRPNWVGPQVLVYHHTRDYMRRVSQHVTIGSAYKWDKALGSYFVLCRAEA